MEPDFSGWATKAGLKCTDGRTIIAGAFKEQDQASVPLVWQHGHDDPDRVLGHAILEDRLEGVWAKCYFNESAKAAQAKELVRHGDIKQMSIWANQLVQRAGKVLHGAIREVSLVLSGANPGAMIENITLQHADGSEEELDEEARIFSGEEIVLDQAEPPSDATAKHDNVDDLDLQKIVDTMNDKQKDALGKLVEDALVHAASGGSDRTIQDVVDTMDADQQQVMYFLIGQAVDEATGQAQQDNMQHDSTKQEDKGGDDTAKHDNVSGDATNNQKGSNEMTNVFDQTKSEARPRHFLSQADKDQILHDAMNGTLKGALEAYAEEHLEHGIEDIDILFPEAQAITTAPEFFARRQEWVNVLLNGVTKRPFSRIKTHSADLTLPQARAKGYVKGAMKKEEFFRVSKRVTTPTTIYKKQKLDRDDMIDITDFDVVAWLKGEMRVMLDEEIARAVLVGDGRDGDDEDKISEENIRPVANDHDLFTVTVNVPMDDTRTKLMAWHDSVILHREEYRGSGLPVMFTTERYIGRSLLLRDTTDRKIFGSVNDLATDLRVSQIVAVPILTEYTDIIAILFTLSDYSLGADRGGQVAMFEDFDIDFNQNKYLIETRCSGALTKLKAAMVFRAVAGTATLVAPAAPTFDGTDVTIHDTAHVVYRNADTDAVLTNAGSPYTLDDGETLNVTADAASGYYIDDSDVGDWSFTNNG